jgi:hypothetical protein
LDAASDGRDRLGPGLSQVTSDGHPLSGCPTIFSCVLLPRACQMCNTVVETLTKCAELRVCRRLDEIFREAWYSECPNFESSFNPLHVVIIWSEKTKRKCTPSKLSDHRRAKDKNIQQAGSPDGHPL